MKKILLSTNHPAPYINRWIEILEKKYDVQVLYYYERSPQKKWKGFSPLKGNTFTRVGLLQVIKLISQSDLFIVGGWSKFWYYFGCLIGKIFNTPVFLFSDYPEEQKQRGLKYLTKKFIFNNFFDGILGATSSTCDFYHFTYGTKHAYAFPYMGIPNPPISKDYSNLDLSDTGKLNVFIANNFIKRKGYASIWSAFSILNQRSLLSRLSIVIAGDGEEFQTYKEKFERLHADIKLLGWIENEEYNDNMEKADIFIHASDFEPFGIPPIDAMKRGMALIASDGVKSINGIIQNGINGFIFPKGNGMALADIISQILKSPTILPDIGKNGRCIINTYYAEESILKNISNIIDYE